MVISRAGALAAAAGLAGCAAVVTAGGERLSPTSPEFRAYVERVFREQNDIASELAFAIEDGGPAAASLGEAEQALLRACEGLNEIAARRRDEQRTGARRGLSAARAAPECERATAAAREALTAAEPR